MQGPIFSGAVGAGLLSAEPIPNVLAVQGATFPAGADDDRFELPPAMRRVTDPIASEEAGGCVSDLVGLNEGLVAVPVTCRPGPAATRNDESLSGAIGLAVIMAILALGVHLIVRYLL